MPSCALRLGFRHLTNFKTFSWSVPRMMVTLSDIPVQEARQDKALQDRVSRGVLVHYFKPLYDQIKSFYQDPQSRRFKIK
jgi:hypothetical protein